MGNWIAASITRCASMSAEGSSYQRLTGPPVESEAPSDASSTVQRAATPDRTGSSHRAQWLNVSTGLPAADDKTVISSRPALVELAPPLASSTQLLGDALVGKRLEHYELVEFVGGGGMGAVFRADDT